MVSTLEETKLAVHTKAGTGYCDEFTNWLPRVPEGARRRHCAMYYMVAPMDSFAIIPGHTKSICSVKKLEMRFICCMQSYTYAPISYLSSVNRYATHCLKGHIHTYTPMSDKVHMTQHASVLHCECVGGAFGLPSLAHCT